MLESWKSVATGVEEAGSLGGCVIFRGGILWGLAWITQHCTGNTLRMMGSGCWSPTREER